MNTPISFCKKIFMDKFSFTLGAVMIRLEDTGQLFGHCHLIKQETGLVSYSSVPHIRNKCFKLKSDVFPLK